MFTYVKLASKIQKYAGKCVSHKKAHHPVGVPDYLSQNQVLIKAKFITAVGKIIDGNFG
jgi:hypothetical protein